MDWLSDPVFYAVLAVIALVVAKALSAQKELEHQEIKTAISETEYNRILAEQNKKFASKSDTPVDIARDLTHRGGIEDVRLTARERELAIENAALSDELERVRKSRLEDARLQEKLDARAKKRSGKGDVPKAVQDDIRGSHRKAGAEGPAQEGDS